MSEDMELEIARQLNEAAVWMEEAHADDDAALVRKAAAFITQQEAEIARLRGYLSEGALETIDSEQSWKRRAMKAEDERDSMTKMLGQEGFRMLWDLRAERDRALEAGTDAAIEISRLREEARAKGEAIALMQRRLDAMAGQVEAALSSHEGQQRNTMAFMAERDELQRKLDEALKALGFYASVQNYHATGWQGDMDPSPVSKDNGFLARAALSQKGEG